MSNGIFAAPTPKNEEIKNYTGNSPEKKAIKKVLLDMSSEQVEIPIIIRR